MAAISERIKYFIFFWTGKQRMQAVRLVRYLPKTARDL